MKTCNTCGRNLQKNNFNKDKKMKDGLSSTCKSCRSETRKKSYQVNRMEILKKMQEERDKNKKERILLTEEEKKQHKAQWYLQNKEEVIARHKKYNAENKEKIAERARDYYQKYKKIDANREIMTRNSKKWKATNRFKVNLYAHKRRIKKQALPLTLTETQWEYAKNYFDNSCAYCGKEIKLTQDHFIPLSNGGEYTHNNIIPACLSCNSSKRDRDFFIWYPKHECYSEERKRKILKFLNYYGKTQQISMLTKKEETIV